MPADDDDLAVEDVEADPELAGYFDAQPRARQVSGRRRRKRVRMAEAEDLAGGNGRPSSVRAKPGGDK